MNERSGYTELEVEGVVIPFKFGTNAYALYCEMHGCDLHEIIGTGLFGDTEKNVPPSIMRLRELFFCAYRTACALKNEPVKYNIHQITEFIDDTDGLAKLQSAMVKSHVMGSVRGNPEEPA